MVNKQSKLDHALELVKKLNAGRKERSSDDKDSPSPWKNREIRFTPELERIAGIERRNWEEWGEELSKELTPLLRAEGGTEELYPVQAAALYELWRYGGVLAVIRVGGGKTLITFLAPYVTRSFRPLLIEPANLLEKTELHLKKDKYNWEVSNFIRMESYEKIGNPNNVGLLYEYKPDLIMLDEGSRVKNTGAVCTKQIGYYIEDCRRGYYEIGEGPERKQIPLDIDPKVLILSGTITNQTIKDYWHILKWFLPRHRVPLPLNFPELQQWALCLDARVKDLHRVKPGALLELCDEEEKKLIQTNPLKAGRRAYRRRLLSVPGIICTQKPFLGASLRIIAREVTPPEDVKKAFKFIRKWLTPDGQEIQDAHVAAMRARQVAVGFYQVWDPMPPDEYIECKREWNKTCRRIITYNRSRLDSEGQVVQAMKGPHKKYPQHRELLEEWEKWKADFGEPNVKSVWINDFAIDFAAKWMKENPAGIVWTARPSFGKRLAKKTGISYYGEESVDHNGRFIENHPHRTPMIASIQANYMGKNLQFGWNKNLIMDPMSNGEMWEQLLGREHREGQPEDEVVAEVFISCLEHLRAFWSAVKDAEFEEDTESPRKLLYADVLVPTLEEVSDRKGPFWSANTYDEEEKAA